MTYLWQRHQAATTWVSIPPYSDSRGQHFRMAEKRLRVVHRNLHVPGPAMAASLPSLSTEEAVKHVLNIVDVLLSGVSARLEMLPEDCSPCTAHHAQLLA